jgi:hypothetical protein
MLKRLSFIFVCLLLLSILGAAFHHHDDCAEHNDCSICMAIHHQADNWFTFAPSVIQRGFTETIYVSPVLAGLPNIFFIPALGRSPPVCISPSSNPQMIDPKAVG